MKFIASGVWFDDKGHRHTFSIESDRTSRPFIKSLVECRYPTSRVIINNVTPK